MKEIHLKRAARLAYNYANYVLSRTPIDVKRVKKLVPDAGGVYVAFYRDSVIYVGRSDNLRKRLFNNHISASRDGHTSTFRTSIHAEASKLTGRSLPYGAELRNWMIDNLTFSFVKIQDRDVRGAAEYLLIAACRTPKLLNKLKG